MSSADIYAHILEFRAAMEKEGIIFKGEIEPDAGIQRVHVEGDSPGSRNGWYKFNSDARPAGAFGCWKKFQDQKFTWVAERGANPMTPAERAALRAKIEADKARRAAEQQAKHDAAAARAQKIWDAAGLAPDTHPYLKRKGVGSNGIRMADWSVDGEPDKETGEIPVTVVKNALIVPLFDRKDHITSLQGIFPSEKNKLHRGKDYFQDGKKRGCYFTIGGRPQEFDGALTFIFCEGFATGATLHEATGMFVVVCFDASNILPVAQLFRENFPDARFVIAADNDQWTEKPVANPGVHHARKAAEATGAIVAIPEFKSVAAKPTDYNDLAELQDMAEVNFQIRRAISPPAPAFDPVEPRKDISDLFSGPIPDADPNAYVPPPIDDPHGRDSWFRILGIDKDVLQIYQSRQRQVLYLTVGKLGASTTFTHLADMTWWQQNFPPSGRGQDFDMKMAANWIIRTAETRPGFDETSIRGRGAWDDDGRIVFHFGDVLMVDGVITDLADIETKYIYERSKALKRPDATPLTAIEGRAILDAIQMFRWVRPASAPAMAGWIALGPICGIIDWRPHVWMTGGAGSGKSTIQMFAHWLLNGGSIYALGNSTEAGIRQALDSDSIPVLFDEAEKNTDKERGRMEPIIALIRQSSSNSPAETLKGTVGGQGQSWHVGSMFCLASIQVGLTNQADRDRFTILNLRGRRSIAEDPERDPVWEETRAALYALQRDKTLPARLLRRVLDMLPITLKNIEVFADVAAQKFSSQREGDQYGALMAGCWSLIHDGLATKAEAKAMFDAYDWSDHIDDSETEDDSSQALHALMEAPIRTMHGQTASVAELIQRAAGYTVDSLESGVDHKACTALLMRHGMRVEGDLLCLSNSSTELIKLLGSSQYASDLKGQLLRTPGASSGRKKDSTDLAVMRFGGPPARFITVPLLPQIVDPRMVKERFAVDEGKPF